MPWFLHASKVAAAIGAHKYMPASKIAKEMFKKRFPAQYQAIKESTGTQRVETKIQECVQKTIELHQDAFQGAIEATNAQECLDNVHEIECDISIPKQYHEMVKETIQEQVFTTRGIQNEETVLNQIETSNKSTIHSRNSEYHKIRVPYNKSFYFVGGYLDGIEDTDQGPVIVEVKNRQRRLFDPIPEYEVIQCQVLMRVTGITKCKLVQQLGEKSSTTELEFDPEFWDELESKMTKFILKMDSLVQDQELQEELFVFDAF